LDAERVSKAIKERALSVPEVAKVKVHYS